MIRIPGLVALVLAGGIGLLVACSGPETQSVLNGTPGSASTTSGGNTSGDDNASGGNSNGGNSNGGVAACDNPEDEPNDDEDEANKFSGTICGEIDPKGDEDWITFTLKPTTQTLSLQFSGRVRLRVRVEGRGTTELTPDGAGAVPFVRNTPYYVQVVAYTDSESSQAWSVTVVEK